MGRIITQERRDQIARARAAQPDALGPMLAELVLDGNIPIEAVAKMLLVSEPTVYRWMYCESAPRDQAKILMIKRFLTVLRKAKRANELPLSGTTQARVTGTAQLIMKYRPQPTRSA